jgi:type I restriction enzyme M protein
LLFFDKGTPTKEIWYYEHRLPEGAKAYNKTRPIQAKEFEPIKKWWNNREENDVAWKVQVEDLKTGFDLDVKNPHRQEDQEDFSSAEVMSRLNASIQTTQRLLSELAKQIG